MNYEGGLELKIGILKRIEALHLPAEMDVEITEDEKNAIVTIRLAKDEVVTPAPG